jgi:hypothetical protein
MGNLYENLTIPVPGFAFQLHGSTVEEISRYMFSYKSLDFKFEFEFLV